MPAEEGARTLVRSALGDALDFLEHAQSPSGGFPVLISLRPEMDDAGASDPAIFPTALVAHCLSFAEGADAMRERALDFLLLQADRHRLWRHWTAEHPHFRQLPPDVDDTACVSAALARAGRPGAADRALLLANCDHRGRFLTWVIPRAGWRGWRHARATLPQIVNGIALAQFFRTTSAAPADVDAGVNANVLHYLGAYPGHEMVVDYLLDILRRHAEDDADKWYDNRFVLWYLFGRALTPLCEEAAPLLLGRLAQHEPRSALEQALALSLLLDCGELPSVSAVSRLLALQRPNGSWPRAAVYFGGRERRGDGSLAPPHPDTPRWGSDELTTGFCVEALARWLRATVPG